MKNITKKILIGLISLNLLVPMSIIPKYISNVNISAKARTHHYKRLYKRHTIHRHRHHKKMIRRRKRAVKHHTHRIKLTRYSNQMAYQSLNDINRDRRSYGVSPVIETKSLNHLANVRAHQLIHNFSHYDNHGQTYYKQDAKKMRINLRHYYHNRFAVGENIASAWLDYGNIAYTNMPNDPHRYINRNGYDMANMDEDSMFNYDSGSYFGHRKNILNRNFHHVGIGVAHKNNQYYIAEDFNS